MSQITPRSALNSIIDLLSRGLNYIRDNINIGLNDPIPQRPNNLNGPITDRTTLNNLVDYLARISNYIGDNAVIGLNGPISDYRQSIGAHYNGIFILNKTNKIIDAHLERGLYYNGTLLRPNECSAYHHCEMGAWPFSIDANRIEVDERDILAAGKFSKEDSDRNLKWCIRLPLQI